MILISIIKGEFTELYKVKRGICGVYKWLYT